IQSDRFEARELRKRKRQGGNTQVKIKKARISDAGFSGGESNYSSSSRYNENSGASYGRFNGGSNYGGNGYGSPPNDSYGNSSNSYGGGSSKNDDITLFYGSASS